MTFQQDTIPELLQRHPRWLLWDYDGNGKKAPRRADRPDKTTHAHKSTSWSTFAKATDAATKNQMGVGFALGRVEAGPAFAGIDLDDCRNPETGAIEPWAQKIIEYFNSYTEISPSGTGVKIFVLGSLLDSAPQGKVYKIEVYDRDRYFTVTGNRLSGETVEDRTTQLRNLHAGLWSRDLLKLLHVFGFVIGDRGYWIDIHCPWADGHSTPNKAGDASLHRTDDTIDGYHCLHASCSERALPDVRALFGLKGDADFVLNDDSEIVRDSQENIRRAFAKLGIELSHNQFAEQLLATESDETHLMEDPWIVRKWLHIDETYRFRPTKDFFWVVCEDTARARAFHPVKEYLATLTWDGVPRLDTWLVTCGGAVDTPYIRAVSALPLIAAVRRVRQPGCKFDEMVVLESRQGMNKSTALKTLCPNPEWFSDDLPLNLDAKQIIERTAGKWIIEAAELKGNRQSEAEHLKSMLSRGSDGPVRLAYGRRPVERPRQFIIIGTTNARTGYLKDPSGNRRFWPVYVPKFDLARLDADRDQLWAEAATREASGASIRLPEPLWLAAAKEQEGRRADHPWEELIADAVKDKGGKDNEIVQVRALWAVLAVEGASQSNNKHAEVVTEIMELLGYVRPPGKKMMVRDSDGKDRYVRCWVKASSPYAKKANFELAPDEGIDQ